MRLILSLVAVLLLAVPSMAQTDPPRLMSVTGEGRVEAVPDMATLRVGVVTEARTARDAIEANSSAMAAVLARLTDLGIAERDLQTSEFSVSPRYRRDSSAQSPEITGFLTRNLLTVRVRDLGSLGQVLDEVSQDGANAYEGLSFGFQEPAPLIDEARRRAVAEARRKAGLYAEAAGIALGPLVSLSEAGGGVPRPQMLQRADMAMAEAVPVATGEVSLSARVSVTYRIEDAN